MKSVVVCFSGFFGVCFLRENTAACFAFCFTMVCISISNTNKVNVKLHGRALEDAYCLLCAPTPSSSFWLCLHSKLKEIAKIQSLH